MRHYLLTASILTGLILSACSQEAQIDQQASQSAETGSARAHSVQQEASNAKVQAATKLKTPIDKNSLPDLGPQFQNLDPRDISRAELDEFIALRNKIQKAQQEHQKISATWRAQPTINRGPEPVWDGSSIPDADRKRQSQLQAKVSVAQNRKNYETYVPKTLTQEEVEELLVLEVAQAKVQVEIQEKLRAWSQQDPASRGQAPDLVEPNQTTQSLRLQALQAKITSARRMQRLADRIDRVSASHNISLSDSELNELNALELEQREFSNALNKAMIESQSKNQAAGGNINQSDILNAIPKHELQRMIDVQLRMQEIKDPLEAAEKAARIKQQLTSLSEQSGITILSAEIDETIALEAEKKRIERRAQTEAMEKWLEEGGEVLGGQPLPNDEDYARLKEIEARIKEIKAPMTAAQEAQNPALRQARLEHENREKWRNDWRDKQQSGEVPRDASLQSPSYAELQDRVKDYSTKLKTRADKVGYSIPEADVRRLNSLNEEMLAIRKKVYEMEADGSAMVPNDLNGKTPAFQFTAGMYKVRLIEKKQREILAGLSAAEISQNETAQAQNSQIGTRQFRGDYYGTEVIRSNPSQSPIPSPTEQMIESFRSRGMDVSQAEADELLDFVRELEDR